MAEESYMIIIPKDDSLLRDPEVFLGRLKESDFITLKDLKFNEGVFELELDVEDRPYTVSVAPDGIDIPEFIRIGHHLTEDEVEVIRNAEAGLAVSISYKGDPRVCFHDQLRIINVIEPDCVAILDCPSEKMLSGKWAALAAKSKVQPSPRYLYTVQAISGENGEVWLHTHGLNRCGLYELEILCADKETYNTYYSIIENLAVRIIESEEPVFPGQPVFIARFCDDDAFVVTPVNWKEALKYYPEATMGTAEDREGEDNVHADNTYVIMAYRNEDDAKNQVYTPVQEYKDLLENNPMYFFSTEETDRMRRLAAERIEYLRMGSALPERKILAKIGLIVDDEYQDEDNDEVQREHIWFDVQNVGPDTVTAELTQEPYYVSGIKPGDVRTYPFSDITDWLILTKEARITPDDVYLLA